MNIFTLRIRRAVILGAAILTAVLVVIPTLTFAQTVACEPARVGKARFGEQNEIVRHLQRCLLNLGYSIPAGATGYYGNQTAKAVKDFYGGWYARTWHGRWIGPVGLVTLKKYLISASAGGEVFRPFISAKEFKDYLAKAAREAQASGKTVMSFSAAREAAPSPTMGAPTGTAAVSALIDRVSETNVQVTGIDEPDIVKTDGKEIYYSSSGGHVWWGIPGRTESSVPVSPAFRPRVKIIKALPIADMAEESEVKESRGDLLLIGEKLVVFSDNRNRIDGIDISNPKKPEKKWDLRLEANTSIVGARLREGKIYLVTAMFISDTDVCPIKPLSWNGAPVVVPCYEIYRPGRIMPADATFNVMVIDPASGNVERKASFVGSSQSAVLYMSSNYLYLAYPFYESQFNILIGMIKERGRDLFPADLVARFEQLMGYDIGADAKLVELESLLNKHHQSLSTDDRLKLENELQDRLADYTKLYKRDFERTIITKVALTDLAVAGSGSVPGAPLNQFSFDEYQGNLRIATTIGGTWRFRGGNSVSDVYVLDKNLAVKGSVLGLGETERIYSVRFVEDKGYVVTFRQIDPFYVLDLADPAKPALAGELKIPGYSSYLHPITKDKILGVGMEGSKVKISLFDVTNPARPAEKDKYLLQEYWSEISNTHHAFLIDRKYGIFFLPGSKGGYVFSYQDDKLALVKAVGDIAAKRALYVNDYLYMIGSNKISVLDERTWERVKDLALISS